ncbi:hypothetical protein ABEB36_007164 [Hypothenemus hampei]|uniref:Tetratricopeptide repeat protein 37 n=1 Tax=Hypothenemus hampei TaxID=57062 RepID=A0ABD1ET03_HYPHA
MDLKASLKEAQNAIKEKDFQTALKLSKEVGPTDKALKAFKKAVSLNSENPLVWQGLISYYEKFNQEVNKEELINSYASLLKIESNEAKLLEYSRRITKHAMGEHVKDICRILVNTSKKCTGDAQKAILNLCVECLEKLTDSTKYIDLYEDCFELLLTTSLMTEHFYSDYLTVLYKTNNVEKLWHQAQKMCQLFPSSLLGLSWICKIYNQLSIEDNLTIDCDTTQITDYVNKLLELEPNNSMALFTQAVLDFKENNFSLAKELLLKVTTKRPGLVHAWIILTDACIKLNLIHEAQESLNKSTSLLMSLNNQVLNRKIKRQQLKIACLSSYCEDWKNCINSLSQEDLSDKNNLGPLIKLFINLERFAEVKPLVEQLTDEKLKQFFQLLLLKKQNNIEEAQKLIENSACSFDDWWLAVGTFYWDIHQHHKALEPFLKAAKLNPNNYICFLHLGRYYSKMGQFEKARRCLEKAFKLNPNNSETGNELSKIYRKQNNVDANLLLLRDLTGGTVNERNIWAWMNLGLTYLEQENFAEAINNLLKVLRVQPLNVHCWESLADAYLFKGAFESALKCYQKALELSEFSLYSTLQVAHIKKLLGDFPEAQRNFEDVLSRNNNFVPALKGLSETFLCQAKDCLNEQRIGTARDFIQLAVNNVTLALMQRSELTCLWKIFADCVRFTAKLPEKYSLLKISAVFLGSDSDNVVFVEQDELFNLMQKLYSKSVYLNQDNPFFWHDLAVCYLDCALHVKVSKEKKEFFDKATSIANHCTSLNPENWMHWNLLGIITTIKDEPNYTLAQHSFIKAVIAENNNAIAWTNLGIFYLIMNELELANKAFGEGQRSDGKYVNSWISQGLIAELIGHSDAMGLFRHSVDLGQHQQGSIGYGNWVCDMMINNPKNVKEVEYQFRHMHPIPVAWDNLNWYLEKNPDCGCAWNMFGLLSERLGLLGRAKEAFKQAFVHAESNQRDKARINYGRLLYRTGDYEGAVEIFKNIKEATFNSKSGLALALFKNEQFEESYSSYEEALNWLTENSTPQSELLVALASIAYKFQGPEGAKTLLFQSIGLNTPSPWSLYATFALSLLHSNSELAQLVLKELKKLETTFKTQKDDYVEFLYHYSILLSHYYSLKNDPKEGVVILSRLIHKRPHVACLWLALSETILRLQSEKLKTSAKCAWTALMLPENKMDMSKVLNLAALACFKAKESQQAAIFAQKAIHCRPDLCKNWTLLSKIVSR